MKFHLTVVQAGGHAGVKSQCSLCPPAGSVVGALQSHSPGLRLCLWSGCLRGRLWPGQDTLAQTESFWSLWRVRSCPQPSVTMGPRPPLLFCYRLPPALFSLVSFFSPLICLPLVSSPLCLPSLLLCLPLLSFPLLCSTLGAKGSWPERERARKGE